MDASLVTILAILAVTVTQTSETVLPCTEQQQQQQNYKWHLLFRHKNSADQNSSKQTPIQTYESKTASPALFPGAFSCCTKISDEIPKGILRRVERFEIQKADDLCHLEAVILYVEGRKFCVSPQIRRVKKWMKKNKHKTSGKKPHGRRQRRTKIIKKKEKKQ